MFIRDYVIMLREDAVKPRPGQPNWMEKCSNPTQFDIRNDAQVQYIRRCMQRGAARIRKFAQTFAEPEAGALAAAGATHPDTPVDYGALRRDVEERIRIAVDLSELRPADREYLFDKKLNGIVRDGGGRELSRNPSGSFRDLESFI